MKSLKSKVMDFVDENGSSTWSEIMDFMLETKKNEGLESVQGYTRENYKEYRGYYSSYFSGGFGNTLGFLMRPTGKDKRYLEYNFNNRRYYLRNGDE